MYIIRNKCVKRPGFWPPNFCSSEAIRKFVITTLNAFSILVFWAFRAIVYSIVMLLIAYVSRIHWCVVPRLSRFR